MVLQYLISAFTFENKIKKICYMNLLELIFLEVDKKLIFRIKSVFEFLLFKY